jgi:hypothetical protein
LRTLNVGDILVKFAPERASYNGSIEASQASDVGSIPIARSNKSSIPSLVWNISTKDRMLLSMTMKQPWEIVTPHWNRVFLHESGHALMAVLQGVTCYGIAYLSEKDVAFTPVPPLPVQKTDAHRLFLGAGSAAEATKYSGMSFFGAKDDRKQHGGTTAQFNQSVEGAYNILLGQLDILEALASKVQSNFERAGSDFSKLPQCDMRIDNVVKKVGVLLPVAELNDITK